MRALNILDIIITILFYLMLIIGIITFGVLTLFLFGIDLGIKTTINFSHENKLLLYFILTCTFIYYAFYMYSIFLFKKNVESFTNFKLFTNQVIKNFKVIGIIYLAGYLASVFITYVIPLFGNDSTIKIGIGNDKDSLIRLFDFPLNGLIIGLFFLTLSQVFHIAKLQKEENITLKQENDLTI